MKFKFQTLDGVTVPLNESDMTILKRFVAEVHRRAKQRAADCANDEWTAYIPTALAELVNEINRK